MVATKRTLLAFNNGQRTPGVTVKGTIAAHANGKAGWLAGDTTVTLTKKEENVVAKTVRLSNGNGITVSSEASTETFSIESVEDNVTYILKIEKEHFAPIEKEIVISSGDVTVDPIDLYMWGDVNGDGVLSQKDLIILGRYFAGWSGYAKQIISASAADVDKNGTLAQKDLIIMGRFFARWNGYDKYFS